MYNFEYNDLGELVKKPLLIIIRTNNVYFTFTDTYQYLEFLSGLELETYPRYFGFFGDFIWIQTKQDVLNSLEAFELPIELLGQDISEISLYCLGDLFSIESPA
jgi:hypothetical protein